MGMQAVYRSLSRPFRQRRMQRFRRSVPVSATTEILDVGGTEFNWELAPGPGKITLLNIAAPAQRHPDYRYVTGDITALDYPDRSWDVCFCNSVIEHLGTWQRQQLAARELRRVGGSLWVQTPARAFPIEPHLVAVGLHWLPLRLRRRLVRWLSVAGWMNRPSQQSIDAMLGSLRLLNRDEMQRLFPDCTIVVERLLGLPKSYIAVRVAPGSMPSAVPHLADDARR